MRVLNFSDRPLSEIKVAIAEGLANALDDDDDADIKTFNCDGEMPQNDWKEDVMGKVTLMGPVEKDHPMFKSGPQLFSRHEYSGTSETSQKEKAGEAQDESISESFEDGKRAGALRVAKLRHLMNHLRRKK